MSKPLRDVGLGSVAIKDILAPGFSAPYDALNILPARFSSRNVEIPKLVRRTAKGRFGALVPAAGSTSDSGLTHVCMSEADWLGGGWSDRASRAAPRKDANDAA